MSSTFSHAMVRVEDLERSVQFYTSVLGLVEKSRYTSEAGRYTMAILVAPENPTIELHLTFNHVVESYRGGRNFGHLAFEVDDIYTTCAAAAQFGGKVARPPREGRMAFIRSPDAISIELIQRGRPLPAEEPWCSMKNDGEW